MDYGKASAGGRTLEDPCNGAFDIGVGCGGGDFDAWFIALGTWISFVKTLDLEATKVAPVDQWPVSVTLAAPAAKSAMELFAQGEPWIKWKGVLKAWAAAQQDLRNYASALATWMESQGVQVPNAAPADLPAEVGGLAGALKLAAYLGFGYLAIRLFKD